MHYSYAVSAEHVLNPHFHLESAASLTLNIKEICNTAITQKHGTCEEETIFKNNIIQKYITI